MASPGAQQEARVAPVSSKANVAGSVGPAQPGRSRTALTNLSVCNMGRSEGVQVPRPRVVDFYAAVRRQHSTHHTHPGFQRGKTQNQPGLARVQRSTPRHQRWCQTHRLARCSEARLVPSKNTMEVGRRSRVGVAGPGAGIGGVLFQGPVEVGPLNAGYHGLSGHLFFFF